MFDLGQKFFLGLETEQLAQKIYVSLGTEMSQGGPKSSISYVVLFFIFPRDG